jgi:hypothetical protein
LRLGLVHIIGRAGDGTVWRLPLGQEYAEVVEEPARLEEVQGLFVQVTASGPLPALGVVWPSDGPDAALPEEGR